MSPLSEFWIHVDFLTSYLGLDMINQSVINDHTKLDDMKFEKLLRKRNLLNRKLEILQEYSDFIVEHNLFDQNSCIINGIEFTIKEALCYKQYAIDNKEYFRKQAVPQEEIHELIMKYLKINSQPFVKKRVNFNETEIEFLFPPADIMKFDDEFLSVTSADCFTIRSHIVKYSFRTEVKKVEPELPANKEESPNEGNQHLLMQFKDESAVCSVTNTHIWGLNFLSTLNLFRKFEFCKIQTLRYYQVYPSTNFILEMLLENKPIKEIAQELFDDLINKNKIYKEEITEPSEVLKQIPKVNLIVLAEGVLNEVEILIQIKLKEILDKIA